MKTKLNFMLITALVFLATACYPGGAEYVDELDTSISKADPSYDFSALDGKTYSLPEEIIYIKDGNEVIKPTRKHDDAIYAQMRSELSNLGMTEAKEALKDTSIAIGIAIIEQNNSGAAWYPGGGWWGGYYPGYPGWGWGGYYPWYPVYYSYKTGSVIIEFADYENRDEVEDELSLIYSGALDGLIQGSDSYIGDRIDRGINELFTQTPFN